MKYIFIILITSSIITYQQHYQQTKQQNKKITQEITQLTELESDLQNSVLEFLKETGNNPDTCFIPYNKKSKTYPPLYINNHKGYRVWTHWKNVSTKKVRNIVKNLSFRHIN